MPSMDGQNKEKLDNTTAACPVPIGGILHINLNWHEQRNFERHNLEPLYFPIVFKKGCDVMTMMTVTRSLAVVATMSVCVETEEQTYYFIPYSVRNNRPINNFLQQDRLSLSLVKTWNWLTLTDDMIIVTVTGLACYDQLIHSVSLPKQRDGGWLTVTVESVFVLVT